MDPEFQEIHESESESSEKEEGGEDSQDVQFRNKMRIERGCEKERRRGEE